MKKLHFGVSVGLLLAIVPLFTSCSRGDGGESGHHEETGHNEHEEGEIELTGVQMETVGIRLGQPESREMSGGIRANGILKVNPQDIADVTPMVAGIVRSVCVREGESVKAGQLVATIENPDIVSYQGEYRDALDELEYSRAELQRQETLAREGAGVRKNLERARTDCRVAATRVASAERKLRMAGVSVGEGSDAGLTGVARILAPISGTVNRIYATTGSMAEQTSPMMTITDASRLYADLIVYDRDMQQISVGNKVRLWLTNGGSSMEGVVENIGNILDSATGGVSVRVQITSGKDRDTLPGMAVGAYLENGAEPTPVVPEDAVVSKGGRDYIYVLEDEAEEDGEKVFHFKPLEIVAGTRENGFVAFSPVEHLSPDARIVISKAFYIASMAADHGEHNH